MRRILGAVLLLFIGTGSLHAQWVPLTAKRKEIREVFVNGQKVETHIREGYLYRRSDGSTLEEWTKVDGNESAAVGFLADYTANAFYQLNLATRSAIEQRGNPLPRPIHFTEKKKPVREDSVGGIRCGVVPIRTPVPGQGITSAGELCWSEQYSLMLKRDWTFPGDNQTTVHEIMEVYDVQAHHEPDPKLFDLHARNFTVQKKTNIASPRP